MATVKIKNVIAEYIQVVVKGDLPKLKKIAEDGEAYLLKTVPIPESKPETTRSIQDAPIRGGSTTRSSVYPTSALLPAIPPDRPQDLSSFDPLSSRCTIPMAITLLSTVDFFGMLMTSPDSHFNQRCQNFFFYDGIATTPDQREIFTFLFRNGMMHGFFPKGANVGVSYDSSLDESTLLLVDGDNLTLNVKALYVIVIKIVEKVFSNTSDHAQMQICFDTWYTTQFTRPSIEECIRRFKMIP